MAHNPSGLRPRSLSLRANFSWTFAGNVVYAGCQWAMLMILAKLTTPEMVGRFSLGLVITTPVIMFTNLQTRSVQATDAKGEYFFGHYLALRLISTVLSLPIILGIVAISGYHQEAVLVILAVGLAKAFESISDVYYGLLQQKERMDRIAKSMMIKGPLSLLALGAGVYMTGDVLWGSVGLAVAWAMVLVGYDVRSGALALAQESAPDGKPSAPNDGERSTRPCWAWPILAQITWLALPLGIMRMLIALNANIPRYFLERHHGEHGLGIFSAMAYLMVAGNTVVAALGQSATPRLAKYYADGKMAAFNSLLLKLMGIGMILAGMGVSVALLAGREILTLLYRPEYASHVDVFIYVTIASGITYVASILNFPMMAARLFKQQTPLFAFVTGITVLACFWQIPSHGLKGATVALIISGVSQVIGSSLILVYHLYGPRRVHKT